MEELSRLTVLFDAVTPHEPMTPKYSWMALAVALGQMAFASGHCESVTQELKAAYPEGPLWLHGRLYYVEYAGRGIKRWDGKHATSYWEQTGCGPSGLIPFGQDHLLVACYDANTVVELDSNGKTVRTIDRDSAGKAFVGPNDFAADAAGAVYVSASGVFDVKAPISGAVLRISADGHSVVEVANTIHYANGLALAEDGRTLLVAEMLAGRVLAFPIGADGSLGVRRVWARLQDLAPPTSHEDAYNGPDGLKLGGDGNFYIVQNGSGRVLVVSADQKLVRILKVPTPYVTNLAFGPGGTDTIYITASFDPWKAPFPGAVYLWRK